MRIDWATLKGYVNSGAGLLRYVESASCYYTGVFDGSLILECELPKDGGTDVTDFETNYKPIGNLFFPFIIQFQNIYQNITGNATTVVKSGAGYLHALSINNANTGGVVTIYDNTAGSGTKIGTFQVGTPSGGLLSTTGLQSPLMLDIGTNFTTGLTIVTSGSSSNNITVYYK